MATRQGVEIFSVDRDHVVDALVATGRTTYQFALEAMVPLIDRLKIQRRIQNPRFYDRLKRDIQKRCVMPAITLAFVRSRHADLTDKGDFKQYVERNIGKAFVLDGIQRLSTLQRAYESALQEGEEFPLNQSLFLNILVCKSTDNLLYRMITLNNGQRAMTTRHQIEILTSSLFDGDDDSVFLVTERDSIRRDQGVFAKSDFVLGYIAFMSNSTTVDSQKLIQEKLDELLASKILEHDPTEDGMEFSQVMGLIAELSVSRKIDRWFKLSNNLIGFCASVRDAFPELAQLSVEEFEEFIDIFEEAFRAFDLAKIKLSRARRQAVAFAVKTLIAGELPSVADLTGQLVEIIE